MQRTKCRTREKSSAAAQKENPPFMQIAACTNDRICGSWKLVAVHSLRICASGHSFRMTWQRFSIAEGSENISIHLHPVFPVRNFSRNHWLSESKNRKSFIFEQFCRLGQRQILAIQLGLKPRAACPPCTLSDIFIQWLAAANRAYITKDRTLIVVVMQDGNFIQLLFEPNQ